MARKSLLSDEKRMELMNIYRDNPSAAARDLLGIDLAPHQRVMLKSMWDCNNVITILSRGCGKCIKGDSMCLTDNGFYEIKDLHKTDKFGFNNDRINVFGENGFKYATNTYKNKKEDIYSITTSNGYSLDCVGKHKIRVISNGEIIWKRADEITKNDVVAICRDSSYDFHGDYDWISEDEAYLIGALVGDGCFVKSGGVGFTNIDKDIIEKFENNYSLLGAYKFSEQKDKKEHSLLFGGKEKDDEFFKRYAIKRTKSTEKEIPVSILRSNKKALSSFLSGLFDTDGDVSGSRVSITQSSQKVIRQIHTCLLSFGIISTIRERNVLYKGQQRKYFTIDITSYSRSLFYKEIGFKCKRKQDKLAETMRKNINPNKDTVKECWNLLLAIREELHKHIKFGYNNSKYRVFQVYRIKKYNYSYENVKKFLDLSKEYCSHLQEWKKLKEIHDKHYYFDNVVKVEMLDEDVTYDVSVPDGHSFISNGFISHNTFIDAVFAVLRAMLYPGEKVGIFGPSYRQCLQFGGNNIFTNNGMVDTSDIFRDDITHIQSDDENNRILNKWMNNDSDGYEIKTSGMYSFSAKNGHRILVSTENGIEYKNIEDISIGDILPIRIGFNYFGEKVDLPNDDYVVTGYDNNVRIPTKITKGFAYFLGLICGDGCITKSKIDKNYRVSFVSGDYELGKKYLHIMKEVFDITNVSVGYKKNSNGKNSKCKHYTVASKHLYKFLEKCGLSNCGSLNKSIPDVIKSAPKEYVCEFLRGLFDTDGFASFSDKKSNSMMVGLSTSSKKMAEEVRDMLLNIGIFSKITESKKQGKKEIIKGKTSNISTGYRVYISSSKYISKYMSNISFLLSRKRAFVENNIRHGSRWCDRMVYPKNVMDALKKKIMDKYEKKVGAGYFYKSLGQIQSKYITPERINLFLDSIIKFNCDIKEIEEYKLLKNMYKNDYAFVEVIDKSSRVVKTFDIEVENEHCYWAGGFIHHNSKFIFDEISKIYDISPILRDSCEKKPTKMVDLCYLQFKSTGNRPGSVIHALPLGSGDTIRGARYFTIIGDEAAQIPREVLDVVVRGMMATSKNPMEQVKAMEEQKRLLAEGKIDKIKNLHNNKIVLSSTAYYQYNHLWTRVKGYIDIIMEKAEKAARLEKAGLPVPSDLKVELRGHDLNGQIPFNIMKDENRALIAFNCDDMPDGFMNTESIEEAKREMPRYQYLMEYYTYFPPDSEGFFPMSLLDKSRKHGDFTCEFSFDHNKDKDWITIMGCDPARSGDNFAISIFKVNIKTEKIRLIRVLTYNKMTFPFMHLEIRRLRKLYDVSEIAIDSGGGGQTIRDLLADPRTCPPGDDIILQRDFDEHRFKQGKRILRLVEFSKYEWLADANNNLLLGLQNGTLQIAGEKGSLKNGSDFEETPDEEAARREIDKTIEEMQNIVVTRTQTGRMHWDTPQKHQRKDRYSSVLIGYDQAYSYLDNINKPQSLVSGFWAQ